MDPIRPVALLANELSPLRQRNGSNKAKCWAPVRMMEYNVPLVYL